MSEQLTRGRSTADTAPQSTVKALRNRVASRLQSGPRDIQSLRSLIARRLHLDLGIVQSRVKSVDVLCYVVAALAVVSLLHQLAAAWWPQRVWLSGQTQLHLTRAVVLRAIALIAAGALASLSVQVQGLIGERGLLPVNDTLDQLPNWPRKQRVMMGLKHDQPLPPLWRRPFELTVSYGIARFLEGTFRGRSDRWLLGWCTTGVLLALLSAHTPHPLLLGGVYVCYLSMKRLCGPFLNLQWDALLLETLFMSIPLSVRGLDPLSTVLLLWELQLLLFRLMFGSGVVKLTSGDRTWRRLTAMSYHFHTQPLPATLGYLMHFLPMWAHKANTLLALVSELPVPVLAWLGFLRPEMRYACFLGTVGLQLAILTTGHYGFFNWQTMALGLVLLDDWAIRTVAERLGLSGLVTVADGVQQSPEEAFWLWKMWAVPQFLLVLTFCMVLTMAQWWSFRRLMERAGGGAGGVISAKAHAWLAPLYVGGHYGLFANMTTYRHEIIIEGSDDGKVWHPYEFKYKPGAPERGMKWVPPLHMPRLDWRLWFLPFSPDFVPEWFNTLMLQLLEGSPVVLGLFDLKHSHYNKQDHPPTFVQATLWDYTYRRPWEKPHRVWNCKYLRPYYPAARLLSPAEEAPTPPADLRRLSLGQIEEILQALAMQRQQGVEAEASETPVEENSSESPEDDPPSEPPLGDDVSEPFMAHDTPETPPDHDISEAPVEGPTEPEDQLEGAWSDEAAVFSSPDDTDAD